MRGLPPIASEHELADELEIKRFVEKFFKAFVLFALRNVGIDDFLNSFLGDFLDKALGFAGVDGGANRDANTARIVFFIVFSLYSKSSSSSISKSKS